MRCPKCGFISFDHLETCLKCKKSIKNVSDTLHGSVYNVASPSFLKFNTEPDDPEDVTDEIFDAGDAFDDEEIRDPDLDILLNDDAEAGDEVELVIEDEDSDDIDFSLSDEDEDIDISLSDDEEEDDEIAFSFGDDEEEALPDIDELAANIDSETTPLQSNLPDELSDISDLEPPSLEEVSDDVEGKSASDDFDFDLDLDLDLDLDEETPAATKPPVAEEKEIGLDELSLGDLDLDIEPEPISPKKKPASTNMDIDDDLNFDLDLGDLKLDDD